MNWVLVSLLCLDSNQNVDGNGGAEKEVGCQGDHGLHIVVIHQILADFLFGTTPVKNTGKADNGRTAFAGKNREPEPQAGS